MPLYDAIQTQTPTDSCFASCTLKQRLAASAKLDKVTSYGAINTYTAKGVCGMPARGVCAAVADKIINFGSKYANMVSDGFSWASLLAINLNDRQKALSPEKYCSRVCGTFVEEVPLSFSPRPLDHW